MPCVQLLVNRTQREEYCVKLLGKRAPKEECCVLSCLGIGSVAVNHQAERGTTPPPPPPPTPKPRAFTIDCFPHSNTTCLHYHFATPSFHWQSIELATEK